jgi:protein MpaA
MHLRRHKLTVLIGLFSPFFNAFSQISIAPDTAGSPRAEEQPLGVRAPAAATQVLAHATTDAQPTSASPAPDTALTSVCMSAMAKLPSPPGGNWNPARIEAFCGGVKKLPSCQSVEGIPIYHGERPARAGQERPLRFLLLGLVHGDEAWGGSLVRLWTERLQEFEPRSHWRIVPVMNPDGWKRETRVNARGVDLNRNLPTADWKIAAANPRRNPGATGGSEPETQCTIAHIDDFKPDFVVSVHTPYGIIDFDGPASRMSGTPLPWKSLGTFPGSLGRYLWKERHIPVMTVELAATNPLSKVESWKTFQDAIGTFALKVQKTK